VRDHMEDHLNAKEKRTILVERQTHDQKKPAAWEIILRLPFVAASMPVKREGPTRGAHEIRKRGGGSGETQICEQIRT